MNTALLEPVAIVGVACRLPGAPNLAAFETLLWDGIDAVRQVPDSRWARSRYFHPDRGQAGKSYSFSAGLLDQVDQFDAEFFGISPREAAQMDPQQRLMLELAHEAIEDAGIDGASLAGASVGVYVGGSSWDYLTMHTGDPAIMDAYAMTGAALCSLSNRVSYAFDLRGPSLTMDTACSSSLVALHHACEAIRSGQVPMAMVGGVNLLLAPHGFIGFSAASMLSPRGRCHSFDARADGYVRAEGGVMLLLRPLRDALADGDTIHALIRGTGVNSDGRTNGFSLPNQHAQADLLRAVYGRFELDPRDLCYVEAHGTGTPAGDPIEAGALGEVLGQERTDQLPIGSVKTNIGHLEAASGLAGLLKAVLVLKSGSIPPSLHCATPNPAIPFDRLNLKLVPSQLATDENCRLAGVNSFGFGGTNAHAVLEAMHGGGPDARAGSVDMDVPLVLSARSAPALRALAAFWRDALQAGTVTTAMLRAASLSREAHRYRLVANGDATRIAAALTDWLDDRGNHDVVVGEAAAGKVAFVFSGNGSQWSGMGVDACRHSPAFQDALTEIDAALLPVLGWSVTERLTQEDGWTVSDTTVAQPLLFAVQVATVQALRHAGIHPTLFLGHSVGEVAAAWAAGALTLEQACRVIAVRSRLQAMTVHQGRMGVLALPPDRTALALEGTRLEVAAWNASASVTISGPAEDIVLLADRAEQERWAFAPMELEHAFHSAAMDVIRADLLAELSELGAPPCPATFISTVRGGGLPGGQRLDATYWWRNVREPVRFAEAADEALRQGARILVEIGPQAVLQAYLTDALARADVAGRSVVSLTRRSTKRRDPIAAAASRCHVAGADMRGASVFAGPREHRGLPSYPWQRQTHWLGRTVNSIDVATLPVEHPLLGTRHEQGEAREWVSHIGPALQPWLTDHVVGGAVVAPAAMLLEMALAAARARFPGSAGLRLLDVEISRPLTFEAGTLSEVRLRVGASNADFEIASRPRLSDQAWTVHATGQIAGVDSVELGRGLPGAVEGEVVGAAALYEDAAAIGLSYGPAFQVVTSARVGGSSRVDVELALPGGAVLPDGLLLAPTLLDGAFQGLVALASRLLSPGDAVLPWRFGRVCLLRAGGAVLAAARVVVTRVGPRSVRADILGLDDAGAVVVELLDCWFVRVQLGSARPVESWAYHEAVVVRDESAGMLRDDSAGAEAADCGETCLLADAFAGAAVGEAFRAALPAPDAPFTVASLVAAGIVGVGERERCAELLGWLHEDGLASLEDGVWRLSGGEGVADDIYRTLVFGSQGAIIDAALLAGATETLATCLRGSGGVSSDDMLHASSAGQAMVDVLTDRIGALARGHGGPLRVLQLGAGRGSFSRHLLRVLGQAVMLDALTEAADRPALAEALAGFPDATAASELATTAGPYDVIVGLGALTMGADIEGVLGRAPGALLLLVEPGPNRAWRLVWPEVAGTLRDGAGWAATLPGLGVGSVLVENGWNAALLSGRVEPGAVAAVADRAEAIMLVADADDELAGAIEAGLLAGGPVSRRSPGDEVMPVGCTVLIAGPGQSVATWLAVLARYAEAAPKPRRLVLVSRDGPLGAALGGLRRVIANELPDVDCRHITVGSGMADRAVAEICRPGPEPEVTWSEAGRTVPRLRAGLPGGAVAQADQIVRLAVARPGLLDSVGLEAGPTAGERPGPGQVAISVRAAGLNFRDVMWAMDLLPDEALLDGFTGPTLGLECAGEVIAVGDGVEDFAPGDRVMAFAPASLATQTVTAAHAVMAIPDGMDFAAAATIPVAFLTVAYALGHLARLEAGERVLVHGGAGGVGLAAIQWAKQCGAVVFATAGTAAKRAMLRRLGVEHVLDSRTLGFADEVMRLTGGDGVDVVLNSLSGEAMESSLALLRPFGRFLELGKRDFYGNTRVGLRPFRHNISYFGVDVDQLPLRQPALAASLLAQVADKMRDGTLRPLPFRSFDAADAASAFRLMQGAGHVGKIVIGFDRKLAVRRVCERTAIVRGDRSYIVTGGLDGFGLEAARWLVRQGARHLVLLSRRGDQTPGAAEALAELGAELGAGLGASAVAHACDVADEDALAGVLGAVRGSMPPVGGVIHAAVAMDDGLLPTMDAARFERALHAKFGGAAALDRLTRSDPIELFIVFSSVTSVLGNPGQANYVAANAAAEAVVRARHREGLPGLAVQWGPIGDAGYLTREAEVGKLLSKRLGERLMSAADALSALPTLLECGLPVVGLARVRWGQLGAGLPLMREPLFDALRGEANDVAGEIDLAELLANATPEEAKARLTELLTAEIARIMRLPAGSILPHRPLADLGMDSLMAVELRMAVEERFGLVVPVLALSTGATIAALAGRMINSAVPAAAETDAVQAMADRIGRFELVEPS